MQITVKKGDTLSELAAQNGVKVSDISGYRSGNPDLIYPDEVLTVNKPDNATDGAFDDTTDSKGFDFAGTGLGDYGVSSEEDAALEDLINNSRKTANTEVDERAIRRRNLDLFQNQVDSVNQIYDSLVFSEKEAGRGREGQGRAIANRQGLVGSQRGETQRQNIVARNKEIVKGIQAERAYKINEILQRANTQSLAEIQAEREAKRQGASDYLSYLSVQDERRDKRVKDSLASLLSQGFSLDDLSGDEIAQLSKDLRVSVDTLRSTYQTLLPEDENADFTLSANDIRYDKDGNVIARGSKVGSGSSSGGGSSSSGGGSTGGNDDVIDVLSYEEFIQTPEAIDALIQEQSTINPNYSVQFSPEERDAFFRKLYDEQVAELESQTGKKASVNIGKTTQTEKNDLGRAGLLESDAQTQSFFLGLPSKTRDEIMRGVAAGIITKDDLTIQNMQSILDDDGGGSSGSSGGGDPFADIQI